jgi:hypothetical protein
MRDSLLIVALLLPNLAAAGDAPVVSLGARFGGFLQSHDAAYGGHLAHVADRLDAADPELSRATHWGTHLAVHAGPQFRQRLWSVDVDARFARADPLDYRYRRTVIPLTFTPRLKLDGEHVGLRLGGGYGVYVVHTTTAGWLGARDVTRLAPGGLVEAALAVHLGRHATLELSYSHDWVELPETDPLLRDAGDGSGHGLTLALQLNL